MIRGIDVSKWQGKINWARVAETNFEFVIIKATQGLRTDPKFHRNWGGAGGIDIVRGAYHLIELDQDIGLQVNRYLSLVDVRLGDLLALDVETSKIKKVSPARAHEGILEWLETVKKLTGLSPLLYISPRGVKKLCGNLGGLHAFPLWDVDYERQLKNGRPVKSQPDLPEGWDTWSFWQFTSNGDGHAHGMESGGLDLNLFNGDRSTLREFVNKAESVSPCVILTEEKIQEALGYNEAQGYDRATVNMIFETVGANPWDEQDIAIQIANWQHDNRLLADGKVGPKTLRALRKVQQS